MQLINKIGHDVLLCNNVTTQKKLAKYWLILAAGGYLGLRGSDLISLCWKDFLSGKKSVKLKEGKTKKKRELTLHPEVLKIATAACRYVDPITTELPILHNKEFKPVGIHELNRIIKVVFKKYGIETVNPSSHTLRKTFGMRVFESHGSSERALILVSKILNHSSLEETKKYVGIEKVQIENAYLKL